VLSGALLAHCGALLVLGRASKKSRALALGHNQWSGVLSGAFAVHCMASKKSECGDAGAEACTAEQGLASASWGPREKRRPGRA